MEHYPVTLIYTLQERLRACVFSH